MTFFYWAAFLTVGISLSAQNAFQWRLSSDAGLLFLHDSSSQHLASFNPALTLKYSEHYGRHQFQFQGRLRPEFYEGRSSRALLNLGGTADYRARARSLTWDMQLSEQRQHFYGEDIRFYMNSFRAGAGVDWEINPYIIPRVVSLISAQSVTGDLRSNYLSRSATALVNIFPRASLLLSGGFYAEDFTGRIPRSNNPFTKNIGTGWGWLSNLEYNSSFTWRIAYRRIFRRSTNLDDNSVEQQFTLVAGKPLTQKISTFFYIDITKRKSKTDAMVPIALRINNGNYENRWYGKIAYEWTPKTELSIKAGYIRYDWYQRSPLSGIQLSVGVRLQN